MRCFFVSTGHIESRLWFTDDADFIAGMNLVAVCVATAGIRVLAFILMSNHVHFVLECSEEEEAIAFINDLKKRYSMYYENRHHIKEFLRNNSINIKPIFRNDLSLQRAIAYVQMNCIGANICSHPSQYCWGTGNTFFSSGPSTSVPLGSLSFRKQYSILHSNEKLPQSFILSDTGYILPESYVDIKFVESLFLRPQRYNYFLYTSSKAKIKQEQAESGVPTFDDQVIKPAVRNLCKSLYNASSVEILTDEQKTEILKQLQRRFSAGQKQLARVTGLSLSLVSCLLDTI